MSDGGSVLLQAADTCCQLHGPEDERRFFEGFLSSVVIPQGHIKAQRGQQKAELPLQAQKHQ
jgi:hypothetical protein